MLTLTAAVRRLTVPLVHRPRLYLQARWGYSRRGAAHIHFIFLVGVTSAVLVLLPAAGFYILEGTWTYLDAVYFCIISLCTIGLGDLVPAEQPGQPLRQLYQVAVAAYLLLGLTGVLLLAQTFHRLAELHGITGVAGGISAPDEAADSWPGKHQHHMGLSPMGSQHTWGGVGGSCLDPNTPSSPPQNGGGGRQG
uniref:Potassium channel domain-containing protein n=1 Tax=Accipiter nisus TaxID=211598 RepID=A0A8B9RW20_9AVES